ncbi:putative protein involved in cytokinesis, contains TGc (transglutaminase/protease-like) domain [Limihaloglobus sulfuriphilus]|uniref:Transglutaminase-like domain-containing protein n=1 Tax=Limihaloglobus sulfuriphilus TaxID=1851148 RepID=A0A1Q2MFQ4_9BACT|nr:transglutaminase-like domain-containing protein [Limihaloglobus sulfuriphilus]AQQ71082.1 putative protein involved in cytokinesis, contains TGc (transglutaminase/protease-like) domain [Limihaloglobus sulfuriphilus]
MTSISVSERKCFIIIMLTVVSVLTLMPAFAAEDEAEYYALLMNGKKVGYSEHTRSRDGGKVTTSDKVVMTISRFGTSITVTQTETYFETAGGRPLGFRSVVEMGGMAQTFTGTVKDGRVVINTDSGLGVTEDTVAFDSDILFPEGMKLAIDQAGGIKPGAEFEFTSFVGSMKSTCKMTMRVGEKEPLVLPGGIKKLYRVESTENIAGMSVKSVSWLDDEQRMYKTNSKIAGMDVEMMLCDKEHALSKAEDFDIMRNFIIKAPAGLIDKFRENAGKITLAVESNDTEPIRIPENDNQTVRGKGKSLSVVYKPAKPDKVVPAAYEGSDSEILEALRPTVYVDFESEVINEMFASIEAKATDRWGTVQMITKFVNNSINSKDLSTGFATASQTAKTRRGDCTEHSVLTAALCRKAGIPCRMVLGLLYVEDYSGIESGFLGHAWNEVYVDKKWIYVDSTRPAEPGENIYIMLSTSQGEPADFLDMLDSFGRFDISSAR